jgi:hypothetical protein
MPYASIVLVQSGDHILNTFDAKISECTRRRIKNLILLEFPPVLNEIFRCSHREKVWT